MRTAGVAVVLVGLLLTANACANKHVATQIDYTIVTACAAFQSTEIAAHRAGKISDDTHGRIMNAMGTVWRLAGRYNQLVRDWPGAGAAPLELMKVAGDIAGTMRTVLDLLPGTDPETLKSAKQILSIVEGVLKLGGDADAAH
jgi:hypothetical protein